MSDELRGYYEGGHTEYTGSAIANGDSRFINVKRALQPRVAPGSKILDLGCGDMYFASLLPEYRVTGLDLDESKAKGITKWDLSQTPYPFPDGTFDGVICSEVLEHLFKPEATLAEIVRLLRPGGHVFITVPNFDALECRLVGPRHLIYDPENTFSVEHIRQYNRPALESLMRAAGLTPIGCQGNSPHLSLIFTPAREALIGILRSFGLQVPPVEADSILGAMFPTELPGILIVGRKA